MRLIAWLVLIPIIGLLIAHLVAEAGATERMRARGRPFIIAIFYLLIIFGWWIILPVLFWQSWKERRGP